MATASVSACSMKIPENPTLSALVALDGPAPYALAGQEKGSMGGGKLVITEKGPDCRDGLNIPSVKLPCLLPSSSETPQKITRDLTLKLPISSITRSGELGGDSLSLWQRLPYVGKVRVVPAGTPVDPAFWAELSQNGEKNLDEYTPSEITPSESEFYYSDGDSDTSAEHGNFWWF